MLPCDCHRGLKGLVVMYASNWGEGGGGGQFCLVISHLCDGLLFESLAHTPLSSTVSLWTLSSVRPPPTLMRNNDTIWLMQNLSVDTCVVLGIICSLPSLLPCPGLFSLFRSLALNRLSFLKLLLFCLVFFLFWLLFLGDGRCKTKQCFVITLTSPQSCIGNGRMNSR